MSVSVFLSVSVSVCVSVCLCMCVCVCVYLAWAQVCVFEALTGKKAAEMEHMRNA